MMRNLTLFMFIITTGILCNSQIRKDAELLHEQILPVALTFGLHYDHYDNEMNQAITYRYEAFKHIALGFDYNFYQTGRFNFRAGLHIRNTPLNKIIRIPSEETILQNDFIRDGIDSPNWTYSLPISIEYIRRITPDVYVSAMIGYEFQYYAFTEGKETFDSLSIGDPLVPIIETTFEEFPRSILGGFHVTLGAYLRLDHEVFLKLDWTYQTRNNDRWNETITAQNLQISPDATSNHQWTGGYTAITARFAPPKRWFFKKYRAKSTKFLD